MLSKGDLKEIGKVVDGAFERKFLKLFSEGIGEFFEKMLAPYLDGEFKRIDQGLKENDEDHDEIFRKLDRNRDEHDQIFVKLDSIEKKVDGHDKRIRSLEKTLQTS